MSCPSYSQHGHDPDQMSSRGSAKAQHPISPSWISEAFLDRVSEVKAELSTLDTRIGELSRAYANPNDFSDATHSRESLSSTISQLVQSLEAKIQELRFDAAHDSSDVKQTQVGHVERTFQTALDKRQRVKREHQERIRDQTHRHYRIVRPDGTDADIEQEMAYSDGGNVFQSAMQASTRSGQAQAVQNAERARNAEIRQAEESITQVAELFDQVNGLVISQEPAVQQVQEQTLKAQDHAEAATKQLDSGIQHTKTRNRLRRWMLAIVVLIIMVLALVLGIHFGIK